jgi:MFS transporter, ACS family, tartrate transporter
MMQDHLERSTIRKVYWRLVPLLFLGLMFNSFDRFNVGFAALRMNHDIGLNPVMFGLGASLFYFGYLLLGIPSNLLLHHIGAQKWLGWIVTVWGLISVLTAFIWNAHSFYGTRILLGAAEAGYLPGIAFYVTYWFPAAYRARAIGGYLIGGQIALLIGAPISALIMTALDGVLGLHGWQWMFILESLPAILLGLALLALLTDRPANASWLSIEQRDWLQERLSKEKAEQEPGRPSRLVDIVTDRCAWSLALLFGFSLVGANALHFWMPQIVDGLGHLSLIQVGMLSAGPSLCGIIGIVAVSYSSDRTGDRKFHLSCLYAAAALALVASAYAPNHAIAYLLLCVVGLCINSSLTLYWSLSSLLMTGISAAGAIAFVNTIAQLGGIIGPWMSGYIRARTGSFTLVLVALAAFLLLSALITLTLRVTPKQNTVNKRAAVVL